MKRRSFIEMAALSVAGGVIVPHIVRADEPQSLEQATPPVVPENVRPPIEFVGEQSGVTTEGFSDARGCTCIFREDHILK